MFLTKDAVRLALDGQAEGVACDGCPPLERLFQQYGDGGGELLVCPICFNSRKLDESALVANARIAGATPLWEWIGDGADRLQLLKGRGDDDRGRYRRCCSKERDQKDLRLGLLGAG